MQSLERERLWQRKGERAQRDALDSGALVWVLGALARYFRIPFDPRLVLDRFPPPCGFGTVVTAAAALGLRAGWKTRPASSLNRIGAPFVAVLAPKVLEPQHGLCANRELASLAPEASDQRLAFIVRIEEGRVALFEQGQAGHAILPFAEFAARYTGQVLLVTPERKALQDPDVSSVREPFGFRWFVPELLKHRKVFQDVLLASLAIQLMALATPLFSQVVIDRVIVHHTLNTLTVIGIGLAIFMAFTAAMTWVRQYLILHTGNRIDAVLGLRVFEHLFRLPPRYFEQRPTGVLVARIQGVETRCAAGDPGRGRPGSEGRPGVDAHGY